MWGAVELDLADRGIDYEDTRLRETRTWRWLKLRLLDIIATAGTRSNRLLTAPAEEPPAPKLDDGDPEE